MARLPARSLLASWVRSTPNTRVDLVEGDIFVLGSKSEAADDKGRSRRKFLVNAANEGLCGIQYPSFPAYGFAEVPFRSPALRYNWCRAEGADPRQGAPLEGIPATTGGHATDSGPILQWGGLRHSSTRFYRSEECVDGRAHALSGSDLGKFLEDMPVLGTYAGPGKRDGRDVVAHAVRCLPGSCVWSPSFNQLKPAFPDGVLHCVPPFAEFDYTNLFRECSNDSLVAGKLSWPALVKRCYSSAFEAIKDKVENDPVQIYAPFLGTGVRGGELAAGARMAALACAELDLRETHSDSEWHITFVSNASEQKLMEVVVAMQEIFKLGVAAQKIPDDASCTAGERTYRRVF